MNFVTDKVSLQVNGRVATLEMNRPESLNSMDADVIKGLVCKLKEISDSDDIDIVVLRGKGRAFSAGGDIKTMLSNMNESDFFPVMDCISELIITLYSIPKLTISAITGAAAGLGFSLALATDYIIADQTSKLAMNFIGIGLIPDGGAHFFLEKRLGETRAKQVIWDGKMMNAEEALRWGLIQEVAEGDLQSALEARVSDWLNRPVQAMVKTKKILAEKNRPQLLKVLELEKYGQQKMRETIDHQEGIKAFIEKRKPVFIGK
ncbi:2-(1,2-epoxy-1,2-dihydrophenyl)acetyl-CoA isomerase [Bacillus sp. SORGH_AS 510]|uniref:enoyl-CoA hydratase n=1 Tax=Bacillus sp. SORGH_AS_0510 TaxID=3041771 RepID=UPI00278AFAD8|nr:enoyl-CoA hydratase [Bacillus sp. SORGH_AS_0510]MDQ1147195.1 2-(1,2-epoxy-1,2-dihydrophenyl)acetyl-CoA isomerase [Bacillus sp. SORGH_AS_0510]